MPQIARESVIECARELKGKRYQHQGRDPEIGIDCVAVVAYAYLTAIERAGFAPPFRLADVPNDNARQPRDDSFMETLATILRPKDRADVRPGDTVAMMLDTPYPFHVAVVGFDPKLGGLTVIHAYGARSNLVTFCTEGPYQRYARRVRRCFEYPEVVG
jgi:hypothetical protein